MVAVGGSGTAMIEAVYYNVRSKFPDGVDHVAKNFLFIPEFKSFLGIFTVPKIIGPRKKLMAAIYFSGLQKLFRPNNPKELTQFWAYQILSAVATGYGKIGGVGMHVVYQIGNESKIGRAH